MQVFIFTYCSYRFYLLVKTSNLRQNLLNIWNLILFSLYFIFKSIFLLFIPSCTEQWGTKWNTLSHGLRSPWGWGFTEDTRVALGRPFRMSNFLPARCHWVLQPGMTTSRWTWGPRDLWKNCICVTTGDWSLQMTWPLKGLIPLSVWLS